MSQFLSDVLMGLTQSPKKLSSKYFYDERGDRLFQKIMALPEYYLPECESEIISERSQDIGDSMRVNEYSVVELGAGDGSKTKTLLGKLVSYGHDITYIPLDISPDVLQTNKENVGTHIPRLKIEPLAGDYFQTLKTLSTSGPKMLLFMGSNVGNYKDDDAAEFLTLVSETMDKRDALLLGVDLRKNPNTILNAYNDSSGITKEFNLNLLSRMNRELGANFIVENFDHYPFYDPSSGIVYSYLVSLVEQQVTIEGQLITFFKNELVHTEVSQKYSLEEIDRLAASAGFFVDRHIVNKNDYFSISVLKLR